MDDPWCAPGVGRQADVQTKLAERVSEAGADQFAEGLGRKQEILLGRMPAATGIGKAAAGDQTVHMRVQVELLRPGVQDGQDADGAADPTRIASQFDDGLGSGLDQGAVADRLVSAQGCPQARGEGNGDVEVGSGQDLGLALFEPSLCPRAIALSAMTVFAGMEDGDQGAALGAAPQVCAKRFGAAGDDVADGATMRWQHRRAISRLIAAGEAPENVCHARRSGSGTDGHASEAAHQFIEQLVQGRPRRFRQVGINRRRGDALVAEKQLDDAGVDLLLKEPGGIGMPQGMGCRPALTGQVGRLSGIGKGPDQDVGAERAGSPAVGKEPARIAVRLPHLAQTVMDRPRQRHEAFLVTLAEDPQEPVDFVDGSDFECGGLADPQAAGIDQGTAGLVDRIADIAENTLDLGMRESLRQPLLLGQSDLFLNSGQSRPSVCR